jgi:hypothetical protein
MAYTRRQFLATCGSAGLVGALALRSGNDAIAASASAPITTPPAPASIDIQPIIDAALAAVRAARLEPGRYTRWLGDERAKRPGGAEANTYGGVAAANILYATGHFPRAADERAAFVQAIQANQSAETGLFSDTTHSAFHATANCTAALELFDARPLHPLRGMHSLLEPNGIEALLDGLDWVKQPWGEAHRGAGSFAALFNAGEAPPAWQDRYFAWLWDQQDPTSGLWRKGCQSHNGVAGSAPFFHHLASSFHYVFNYVAVHRPLRYPAAMIDSALRVRRENLQPLGTGPGFSEIDWVYCLTRPLRQCGHRFDEVQAELRDFAANYARALQAHIATHPVPFPDLHALNGTIAAFADLQQFLPGQLRTERPLRLILDRRPFI